MGFWTDCINPFSNTVNHSFWSNRQIYSIAKMCPVCWFKAGHKQMITVPGPIKKSRIDSKPEKDTL